MRRPVLIEVEIEPIEERNDVRGRILVDGHEVFLRDLGVFTSTDDGRDPYEEAALELTSLFGMELAFYANTRERILTAAFEQEN